MKYKCFSDKRLSFLKADFKVGKSTILLTVGLLALTAVPSFGQRIHLDAKNLKVETALQQIEKQSGYSFIYDSSILSNVRSLTLNLREDNIEGALSKLAHQLQVDYTIVNKTITLTNTKKQQENIRLSGTILLNDLDGKGAYPSSGVTISLKGSSKSTSTNNVGEYTLEAPMSSHIIISYLGYKKQELSAAELAKNGNVVLEKSMDYINEVIVTAYGKKESRENQTGSAFTVTSKDLANRPALRIDALLEGVVPGIEFNSQDAGTNSSARHRYSTRIRGDASTVGGATSNEPLWVVDGVPLYTGGTTNLMPGMQTSISPLTYLNPDDIESITVLKDASATTIYGANGSNGVILITTKKGKGEPRLSYAFRTGINRRPNAHLNQLNGPQYLNMVKEMGLLDQLGKLDPTVDTKWDDLYFRTGYTNLHNVNLSGSTSAVNYFLSGSMYDEKHIVIGNKTKRYGVRSNINGNLGKRLSIQSSLSAAYSKNELFNPGNSYYQYSPLIAPFGPNGEYIERDANNNLLQYMPGVADQNDNNQQSLALLGNVGFTLNIWDGFTFVNRNGLDFTSGNENIYLSMLNHTGSSAKGKATKAQSQVLNVLSTNSLSYDKKVFNGDFDAMIGMEARMEERNSVSAEGSNFPNDNIREVSFIPVANRLGTASRAKSTLLSYFGRAGYVYDKRYALNYTYRKDGSSNFGKDVKWGTFSSFGAAWTVSNEAFWPENNVVDFLKFKASYGNNGNSRFSSAFARGIYDYSSNNDYGGATGAIMSRGVNEGLRWENTKMFNTGIDFRLFNRINVAAEYYKNVTHDLIDNSYVSMVGGFRRIYKNVGKIQNSGFELTVNSENIKNEDFSWNTNFILSLNRNKVLEMAEGIDRISGTSIMREGYNSRAIYLVRWAGVDPSTGDPMWLDAEGNITKVYNTDNRVIVGNPNPDFYGGMTNVFAYKNWSLSVFLKYTKGGYTFDQVGRNIGLDGLNILNGNQSIDMLNAWRFPGQLANEPRLSNTTTNSTMNSTRFLMDRTSLALENISLSYVWKTGLVQRLKLSSVTLSAMASKVGLWTPYSRKKGSIRDYESLLDAYRVTSGMNIDNTYADMNSEMSRIANYSFGINIGF